jgi:type I restriction enzyme, S subunit
MSWDEVIFDSIFKIQTKNGLTKPSRIRGEGFKFINMGELFAIDRMFDPKMELVPLSETEKITHKIEKGDLLFARQSLVASGAGKCSIVKEVDELTVFDSHIIRVRLNQEFCDPDFYYYYFKSSVNNLKSLVQQGVQAGIRASDLSKLKVHYPPLETQKRIASILSNYDDLIENNLKRIKLLEETAQIIYKEWFVNFRFPNYEHTKFDAESGLPVGWEKDIIGNQLFTIKRKGKLKTDDYGKEGKFPIIDQANGFIAGYTNNEDVVQDSHLPIVVFGDHTRRVKFVNFPFVSGADGTQLMYPKNENLLPAYFYLAIINVDLSNYAYARHFKFIKEQHIIIPDDKILLQFNSKVYPLLEQTIQLFNYNQKLKEARDILLPRLMNRTIEM